MQTMATVAVVHEDGPSRPSTGPHPRASQATPKETAEDLSQHETEMAALLPGTPQSSSPLKSSQRAFEDVEMGGGVGGHDVIRERDRKRAWIWIVAISVLTLAGFMLLYIAFSRMEVLQTAGKKALHSGIPGAAAMAVQVLVLMWSRTIVNYQYRHGVSMSLAAKTLWAQGGIPRLYRGLVFALIQGPLARFGDTASNDGVQAILNAYPSTAGFPLWIKSLFCSVAAGLWRIFIMPVDTIKTKMQVEGKEAVTTLIERIVRHGPACVYEGWLANQTSARDLTYWEVTASIARADGLAGLFLRGLKMKLLSNALQSILFNITWEYFKQIGSFF